jgi:PIN domain nuclease of toxin-antitoxin system
MSGFVFDSSALIACLRNEPGGSTIAEDVQGSLLCSVNLTEVVDVLTRQGASFEQARDIVRLSQLKIADFDRDLAEQAGALAQRTRAFGLSLGDRACLALAMREKAPVLTADRGWHGLDLDVEVRFVR